MTYTEILLYTGINNSHQQISGDFAALFPKHEIGRVVKSATNPA